MTQVAVHGKRCAHEETWNDCSIPARRLHDNMTWKTDADETKKFFAKL
jgi:hypothetical protein